MQAACDSSDGAMVALLKTSRDKAASVAAEAANDTKGVCDIANINSADQVVVNLCLTLTLILSLGLTRA